MTNLDPNERTRDTCTTGKASMWVWTLGTLEFVASGVMTLACVAFASLPIEKVQSLVKTAEERAILEQIHPMMFFAAAGFFVLGVLPGLALIFLGFGVREGRRTAIMASLAICSVQASLLALVLIANLLAAVIQGEPSALFSNLIVLGGIMLAQLGCVRSLWDARAGGSSQWDIDTDPWSHQPLTEQTR
jgi:hypothetical protein